MNKFLVFIALSFIVTNINAANLESDYPYRLQDLPSRTEGHLEWDLVSEIEHKSDSTVFKSSSCFSKSDLVNLFPIVDKNEHYFSYVARTHSVKNTLSLNIGSIDGVEVFEIVHFYKEPSLYIKMLTFSKQNLLCPFLVISEFNEQMVYSDSYVQGEKIITKAIDNIARKHPIIREFNFYIENGLPEYAH